MASPFYENENLPGNADSAPPGEPDWYNKTQSKAPSTDELRHKEQSGGGEQEQTGTEDEASHLPVAEHENQVGSGYKAINSAKKGLTGRWKGMSPYKKWGSGGIIGIIIAIIFGFLSILPFELIHIKHIITDRVGGVESRTYRIGRSKLYSTQFFFDKEGNYTGNKVGGIRRLMLENRSTKKMVKVLEENGYKIKFDQRTGKVQSLTRVDSEGNIVESYTSNSAVERAWDIRNTGALDNILRTVFPDKSDFWYNRATKQMYRRLGLTRTNWLKDYIKDKTGVTKIESLELQFREALRQKLFGPSSDYHAGQVAEAKDPNKPTPDEQAAIDEANISNGLGSQAAQEGNTDKTKMLSDPSYDGAANSAVSSVEDATTNALSMDDVLKEAGPAAEHALTGTVSFTTLNALGYDQRVCMANSALNDVVKGARILRAAQLMKFALAILNIADAEQNGKHITAQEVQAMMMYINSVDKNQHTMFASSGWQFWTTDQAGRYSVQNFDKNEINRYSVGGGFTGTLAIIRNYIDNKLKLGINCHVVNNPFISFGGLVAGIGLGVFTGGGSIIVNAGAQLATGFATSFAISVATHSLAPMIAGTIITGSEKGTAVGNALMSGAEVLVSDNAASTGMRPLTTGEYNVAEASVQDYQKTELASMSLKDRFFSLNNDRTFASVALAKLDGVTPSSFFGSILSSPSHLFASMGNLFTHSASADVTSNSGCTDSDITSHDLASTPFCNLVMGIPDSVLNDPQYAPDKIDDTINATEQNVDDYGNPIPGSSYDKYLKECTSDDGSVSSGLDIIHKDEDSDNSSYTSRCTSDLFNVYRLYMTIGQGENDALTDNLGA